MTSFSIRSRHGWAPGRQVHTDERKGQTWLHDGQRHRSGFAVQLQQRLFDGLTERVLEARHRNPVGSIALPIAVCCRWSEQFICNIRARVTNLRPLVKGGPH